MKQNEELWQAKPNENTKTDLAAAESGRLEPFHTPPSSFFKVPGLAGRPVAVVAATPSVFLPPAAAEPGAEADPFPPADRARDPGCAKARVGGGVKAERRCLAFSLIIVLCNE